MANIVTCLNSVIMTIPGIGTINGGMILGEIGDIYRFSTPGKLLAFAGLDPSVYQSGNFQAKKTRMSKRAEGRAQYIALGHCAGKLVRVIWKMLTDDVAFFTTDDEKRFFANLDLTFHSWSPKRFQLLI